MQADTAVDLGKRLHGLKIPPGEILELGCGTGNFTRELKTLFPDHPLTVTDLCPEMIEACRPRFDANFAVLDGEEVTGSYSLIGASLVFQWYSDLERGIARALEALKAGGVLAASFLVEGSFPQWQAACQRLNVPFTANALPTHVGDTAQLTYTYPSALDFFQSLKGIGAHTSKQGFHLGTDLRRLCKGWPGPVDITYNVLHMVVRT